MAAGVVIKVDIETSDASCEYMLPPGRLVSNIMVRSTSDQTISIGTTDGGTEISGLPVDMEANQLYMTGSNMLRTTEDTTIFFTGLSGSNTIKIWVLAPGS